MGNRRNEVNNAAPAETRITTSEASKSFGEILYRAADGERFVFSRFGTDRAVLLSKREYDELLELAGIKPARVATAV